MNPSTIIREAVHQMDNLPRAFYKPDISWWHAPANSEENSWTKCHLCLAGAHLSKRLDSDEKSSPIEELSPKCLFLDCIGRCNIIGALKALDFDQETIVCITDQVELLVPCKDLRFKGWKQWNKARIHYLAIADAFDQVSFTPDA